MKLRNARSFLWVGWLAVSVAVPVACGSDDGKKAAFGEGGAGGEAGAKPVNTGGSKPQPMPSAGEGGVPGGGGVPGSPSAGEGGTPNEQPTGGSGGSAAGGVPNEPMGMAGEAGAPSIPVLAQCQGPTLTFADSYVEDQVLKALKMEFGPITTADVVNLTDLEIPFNDANIDITGLECLSALQHIYFSDGAVGEPISVLNLLPNLRSLDFSNGYINDLTEFAVLTHVKELDFSQNAIADLSPLADLTQLESLNLDSIGAFGNKVIDITPLAGLSQLKVLNLNNDEVSDEKPLAQLTQLQELSLRYTKMPGFGFVSGLAQLTSLDLSNNSLTALPDLSKLTKLTSLDIAYDLLASFTPLSALTKLTSLNASYTGLADLSPLAPLVKLDTLDVSGDKYTDATILGALPLLSTLDVSYNNSLTSLEPLVQSQYIGTGDYVTAEGLDCNTHGSRISALIAKGVVVGNSCGL